MYLERFVLWLIAFLVITVAWYFISKALFKKINKRWIIVVLTVAEFVLATLITVLIMTTNFFFVWHCFMLLAASSIVLFASCFSNIIYLITRKYKYVMAVIAASVLFIAGVVNMQIITTNYTEISSPKIQQEHTIAWLSDLHYGSTQTKWTIDSLINQINDANPEILILAGDITDEHTDLDDAKYIYSRFGELSMPVYLVSGNHDRQWKANLLQGKKYSENDLADIVKANNIKVLNDEIVLLGNDISILGRVDCYYTNERSDVKDLPARDQDRYQITVDHQPHAIEDIKQTKADLQLSGHCHQGQLFPLNIFGPLFLKNYCGPNYVDNTLVYTSPGVSGWGIPYRTSGVNQLEIVHLMPQ